VAREVARSAVADRDVASTPGCTISAAIGLPTMLLRPMTTQFAPAV
jgi:hypothetical protein